MGKVENCHVTLYTSFLRILFTFYISHSLPLYMCLLSFHLLLFDYQQIRHSKSSLLLVLHQLTCTILLTDYSRDLKSYLKYCRNVIFAGMTSLYDEETLIERLWEMYEKEEVLITQQLFCFSLLDNYSFFCIAIEIVD